VTRGNGVVPIDAPATAVVNNLADLSNNIATLAELQANLALIDLKQSVGHAARPAGVLAAALTLLLGSVPVLLAGVAQLIDQYTRIGPGWARLLVAGVAITLAVVIGALAASRVGRSFATFERSREELKRNIAWVKTVLAHSGRSSPSQRRRV